MKIIALGKPVLTDSLSNTCLIEECKKILVLNVSQDQIGDYSIYYDPKNKTLTFATHEEILKIFGEQSLAQAGLIHAPKEGIHLKE